jgi:[acyl-carrier-protein] S-malonyltransferase
MPVRWRETLDALYRDGVRVFREVGPGKVLTNLVRRSLVGVEATSLEEMAVGHA